MSTASSSIDTRFDLGKRLIVKAWKDPAFKESILKDPKGLLETQLGGTLPAQVKIYVHEEDSDTLHLCIPLAPSNVAELSDEDLARVAGGTDIVITPMVLAGVTAVVTVAGSAIGSAAGVTKTQGGW
jgi:hypothetical protein